MTNFQFSFNDEGHIGLTININDLSAKASYVRQNLIADFLRATLLMHTYNAEKATLRYNLSPEDEYWLFEKHVNLVLKKIVSNEDESLDDGNTLFSTGIDLTEFTRELIAGAEAIRDDFENKEKNFHGFVFPDLELTALKATFNG